MNPAHAKSLATVAPSPQTPPGAHIPRRNILGVPIALTDYAGTMDVMDEMVDRRHLG